MNSYRVPGPTAPYTVTEAASLEQMLAANLAQQRDAERVTLAKRVAAGEQLTQLKELLGHGEWMAMLKRRKISQATAWRRMRDHRERERIIHVNDLEESVAFSCTTPDDAPKDDEEPTSGEPGGAGASAGRQRPAPPKGPSQASLDFDLTRRQTARVVELLSEGRTALDSLTAIVGELFGGLRAADFDELARHHHLDPQVREEIEPGVIGRVGPVPEFKRETYLPCLESLEAVFRGMQARVKEPE